MTTTNRRLLIAANRPVDILRKFTFDTTGGNAGISTCNAFIKRIKGSTIVWNQMVKNGNFDNTNNIRTSAVTLSVMNNVGTFTPTSTSYAFIYFEGVDWKNTHKYFITCSIKQSQANSGAINVRTPNFEQIIYTFDKSSTNWQFFKDIYVSEKDYSTGLGFAIYFNTGVTNPVEVMNVKTIDLTLMFGAGNEPATVAEFEAMFPLDYYDYNAGQLLSFTGDDIKTTGFNQWDEQWELGTLGVNGFIPIKIASSTQIRSKNKIPVLPNTTYCISCSSTDTGFFVAGIHDDFGGTGSLLLSRTAGNNTQTFTTQSDTRYIAFSMAAAYGTTYKYDICVNISHNGTKNGTYEEYEQHTKDISFYKSIKDGQGNTLFPYGLLSAGSVYDEVTATKAIKRIGAVDMGSLGWSGAAVNNIYRFTSNAIQTKKEGQLNVICSKYETNVFAISRSKEDTICGGVDNQNIYVTDSTYTSGADFKAAMQGVMLYYELAEPIEVPLSDIDLTYYANKWGTEHLLPDNTSVPTTAFALFDVRYKVGTPRT